MHAELSNSGGLPSQRLQRLSTIIMPPHTAVISLISSLPAALPTPRVCQHPSLMAPWEHKSYWTGHLTLLTLKLQASLQPQENVFLKPEEADPTAPSKVFSTLPLPHFPLWLIPPLYGILWYVPILKTNMPWPSGALQLWLNFHPFSRETSRKSTLPGFLLTS